MGGFTPVSMAKLHDRPSIFGGNFPSQLGVFPLVHISVARPYDALRRCQLFDFHAEYGGPLEKAKYSAAANSFLHNTIGRPPSAHPLLGCQCSVDFLSWSVDRNLMQ